MLLLFKNIVQQTRGSFKHQEEDAEGPAADKLHDDLVNTCYVLLTLRLIHNIQLRGSFGITRVLPRYL